MLRTVFFLCLIAGLLLVGCAPETSTPPPPQDEPATSTPAIPFVKEGELTFERDGEPILQIDIEIADTDSTRERGMMEREDIPALSGMLFIFDFEAPQQFWMSNTPLSLDLIYVNAESTVVSMTKYATPFSPDPIRSIGPAQFVVELKAGMADTHGILEGDRIRWTELAD